MQRAGWALLLLALIISDPLLVAADPNPVYVKNGKSLYQQHCVRCHGVKLDGKGPSAANLSVRPPDFHKYLSRVKGNLELEVTIRRGRALTPMHEWDSLLNDQQIADLIAYIRSAVPHLEVQP